MGVLRNGKPCPRRFRHRTLYGRLGLRSHPILILAMVTVSEACRTAPMPMQPEELEMSAPPKNVIASAANLVLLIRHRRGDAVPTATAAVARTAVSRDQMDSPVGASTRNRLVIRLTFYRWQGRSRLQTIPCSEFREYPPRIAMMPRFRGRAA